MARSLRARALGEAAPRCRATPRPLALDHRPTDRFAFSLAGHDDDGEVRRLLRESPFPGEVSVSLECEPDAAIAAGIEGDLHQTIVARDKASGRVVAMASRSVRDAFVNGEVTRLGYLGRLRIEPAFRRHRRLLEDGFAYCRALHQDSPARLYLTSVVADNNPARRLLTAGVTNAAPRFQEVDRLVTLAIPLGTTGWWQRSSPKVSIQQGSSELLADIAACLIRNGARHQFFPVWTESDLCSPVRTPGLQPDDFIVATEGGRVRGCLACWDQRAFKQVVVRSYSRRLASVRPLLNVAARFLPLTRLPPVGHALDFLYLSHLALDDDRAELFPALLDAACAKARSAGRNYVVVALAGRNPLLAVAAHRRHRAYHSVLYAAQWPDSPRVPVSLDGRIPHPDVAVL